MNKKQDDTFLFASSGKIGKIHFERSTYENNSSVQRCCGFVFHLSEALEYSQEKNNIAI
jgi:hypothetical protein